MQTEQTNAEVCARHTIDGTVVKLASRQARDEIQLVLSPFKFESNLFALAP